MSKHDFYCLSNCNRIFIWNMIKNPYLMSINLTIHLQELAWRGSVRACPPVHRGHCHTSLGCRRSFLSTELWRNNSRICRQGSGSPPPYHPPRSHRAPGCVRPSARRKYIYFTLKKIIFILPLSTIYTVQAQRVLL